MLFDKIAEGRSVRYESKSHTGRGKVLTKYRKRTGEWVTLFDKERGKAVTVRPSQVSAR
jgi:hypothetical protein